MKLFRSKKNNKTLPHSLKRNVAGAIYSEEEFRRIIDKERARADRTDHQFSLIVFDLGCTSSHSENGLQFQKILSRTRKIDEIGWYDRGRIGILLPYTPEWGAQKLAESLTELLDPSKAPCSFKIYTYGSDSNIIEDLTQENIGNL